MLDVLLTARVPRKMNPHSSHSLRRFTGPKILLRLSLVRKLAGSTRL